MGKGTVYDWFVANSMIPLHSGLGRSYMAVAGCLDLTQMNEEYPL